MQRDEHPVRIELLVPNRSRGACPNPKPKRAPARRTVDGSSSGVRRTIRHSRRAGILLTQTQTKPLGANFAVVGRHGSPKPYASTETAGHLARQFPPQSNHHEPDGATRRGIVRRRTLKPPVTDRTETAEEHKPAIPKWADRHCAACRARDVRRWRGAYWRGYRHTPSPAPSTARMRLR